MARLVHCGCPNLGFLHLRFFPKDPKLELIARSCVSTGGFGYTVLVAQLCPTLCDPMDCSLPGPSVHGDSPGKNTGVGGWLAPVYMRYKKLPTSLLSKMEICWVSYLTHYDCRLHLAVFSACPKFLYSYDKARLVWKTLNHVFNVFSFNADG